MSKANPKAYFPQCVAAISFRKIDAWAVRMKNDRPYFDTWVEAHDMMLKRAQNALTQAQKDLASATRHLAKVKAMQPPNVSGKELAAGGKEQDQQINSGDA